MLLPSSKLAYLSKYERTRVGDFNVGTLDPSNYTKGWKQYKEAEMGDSARLSMIHRQMLEKPQ